MIPSVMPPSAMQMMNCGVVMSFSKNIPMVPTAMPVTMIPMMVKKRTMSEKKIVMVCLSFGCACGLCLTLYSECNMGWH